MTARANILIADDEKPVREILARVLGQGDVRAVQAADGLSALKTVEQDSFDAIFTDFHMPGLDGLEVVHAIRELDLNVSVVLLTGAAEIGTSADMARLGIFECLAKPFHLDQVREVAERAVLSTRLARAKRATMIAAGRPQEEAGDDIALDLAFDRALASLWMAHQPVVDNQGRVYGYEALLRVSDPALGSPSVMLEAARRLGRGQELALAVRQTCAANAESLAAGQCLFVNVEASELSDETLLAEDSPLLSIAPRVVLDVSDRAGLEAVPDPVVAVAALRERGYGIALDDLGAGRAGIAAFLLLQPEIAKLDPAIVRNVVGDARCAKAISELIAICHDLGMSVAAEAVETVRERDRLLELGCDLFQGHLFGRPARGFPSSKWPPRDDG